MQFRKLHKSPWFWVLAAVLLVGIGARLALDPVLTHVANRQLQTTPGVQGRVGAVHVGFVPGIASLHDVKVGTPEPKGGMKPLFHAKRIDAHWLWGALLHRVVQGSVHVEAPEITLWRLAEGNKKPAEPAPDWQSQVRRLLPIKIDSFDVEHGVVRYRDPNSQPPLDLSIDDLTVHASNLTNRNGLKDSMFAKIMVHAKPLGDGDFRMDMQLDPLARSPTLSLQAKLQEFQLTSINDLLRAYGNFDVSQGTFALFTEVAAKKGEFEGYIKPLFQDLEVRTWKDEVDRRHPLKLLWRELVNVTIKVLENKPTDQVAAKIPFEGKLDNPEVSAWDATVSLLRNAFLRALLPQLDHTVALADLPKKS